MKLYQIWHNASASLEIIPAESLDDALAVSKARAEAYYVTCDCCAVTQFYANEVDENGALKRWGMASGCLGRRAG